MPNAADNGGIPDQMKVAALLLPGFVTERVGECYRTGPKLSSDVEIVASALAFTLLNALLALGLVSIWYRCQQPRVGARDFLGYRSFWVLIFLISVAVGAGWAVVDSRDLIFRVLPLTSRASRGSVWDKVFQENRHGSRNFVKVTLEDGRVYHGNPKYFSEGGDENAVFLSPAFMEKPAAEKGGSSSTKRATCVKVPGEGVLIPKGSIRSIEFRTVPEREDYPCPGTV